MLTARRRRQFRNAVRRNIVLRVRNYLSMEFPVDVREHRNGWTALMDATSLGYVEMARELITYRADVNATGKKRGQAKYATPLILAAANGFPALINMLVVRAADVNQKDQDGRTALMHAAMCSQTESVRLLLPETDDINRTDVNGDSALTLAAGQGPPELLELLLSHQADVDHQNKEGHTALMISTIQEELDCVRVLVERGSADVDVADSDGRNALIIATKQGNTEIFDYLLQHVNNVNHQTVDSDTALTMSAHNGHIDCVRSLLQNGADLTIADTDGFLPFMHAAWQGHADVMDLLLDQCNNNDIDHANVNGETALILSTYSGHLNCVRCLVDRGADLSVSDPSGDNALMYAAWQGHPKILEFLLEQPSCDVNHRNGRGLTALLFSAMYGHFDCLRCLLSNGAPLNTVDNSGNNAVIHAAAQSHTEVLDFLLELPNIDIDYPNHRGETALMYASMNGQVVGVRYLLERGASLQATDSMGSRAIDYAAIQNQVEVVELIQSWEFERHQHQAPSNDILRGD